MDSNRSPDSEGRPRGLSALPLTMPRELWTGLAAAQRAIFERAQAILDCLVDDAELDLEAVCARIGQPLNKLLPAFKLLEAIGLIGLRDGSIVFLRALPDEHVRIVGPDGKARWIFVSRPVTPPSIDPSLLN